MKALFSGVGITVLAVLLLAARYLSIFFIFAIIWFISIFVFLFIEYRKNDKSSKK